MNVCTKIAREGGGRERKGLIQRKQQFNFVFNRLDALMEAVIYE